MAIPNHSPIPAKKQINPPPISDGGGGGGENQASDNHRNSPPQPPPSKMGGGNTFSIKLNYPPSNLLGGGWGGVTKMAITAMTAIAMTMTTATTAAAEEKGGGSSVWRAKEGRPLIIAHRGGAGIFPENTLAAMRGAAALGVDALDMDARLSADGVLFAFHDSSLARTTGESGEVGASDAARMESLNAAARFAGESAPQRVPRIAEILREFAPSPLLFVIELKDGGEKGKHAAKQLAQIIAELNLQKRVIVGSFDGETLAAFRAASGGEVATSAAKGEATAAVVLVKLGLGFLRSSPAAALQIPTRGAGMDLTSPAFIRGAQENGLAVHYWTINAAQDMSPLAQAGADGIFSDYPDILRETLSRLGHSLPPPLTITTTVTPQ